MSIKDEYPKIIKQRINDDGLDDTPDYWETSPTIKSEIELFSRNLQETIDFLNNDCTAEQMIWMSEIFEEISAKLQSQDFVDALRRVAEKYPEYSKKYHLSDTIAIAEAQLEDSIYQQRYPISEGGEKNEYQG